MDWLTLGIILGMGSANESSQSDGLWKLKYYAHQNSEHAESQRRFYAFFIHKKRLIYMIMVQQAII